MVPAWKSDGTHFADFVHHWEMVNFYSKLFCDGRSGNNIGASMNTDTLILAIFIDFTRPPRKFRAGFCIHNVCHGCSLVWPGRV